MKNFFKTALFLLFACVNLVIVSQVQAATKTICTGPPEICNYSTITAAFADSPAEGDVFQVQGTYNEAGESWPISFPAASTTLECVGATISHPASDGSPLLFLSTSSTVQGCNFGDIQLKTVVPASGIRIIDNTFSTVATSTVDFSDNSTNFTIFGNTNLGHISFHGTSTDGLIQDNTLYGRLGGYGAEMFEMTVSSTRIQIIGNTFLNETGNGGGGGMLAIIDGYGITFATNTVRYPVPITSGSLNESVRFQAFGTNYVGGNFIDSPVFDHCVGIMVYIANNASWNGDYTFLHNTFRMKPGCTDGSAIYLNSNYDRADIVATMTADYNLVYNQTGLIAGMAFNYRHYASSVFTQSNEWNGTYGYNNVVVEDVSDGARTYSSGPNTQTADPFLEVDDADATNDLQTAPFSGYLDINGDLDIGATNIARRPTTHIATGATIDYSSVDATSTTDIESFVRSGDNISIASGSYSGFSVSSTLATTSVSIVGMGNPTISALAGQDAIRLTNVASSTISGVIVTGAVSGASTYTITKALYSFGGLDYNQAIVPFGVAPSTMLVITAADCSVDSSVVADGYDVTALSAGGTGTFNIALAEIAGSRETMLVPNSLISSGSALSAACVGVPGFSLVTFINDVFVPTGGAYAYNGAAITSASAALLGGLTTPPRIDRSQTSFAGVRLTNASGATIASVTSTANSIGVLFEGTTANATVSDSVISSSGVADISSSVSGQNNLDNVSFDRTSSTVTGPGVVLVSFDVRARALRNGSATTITGAMSTSTASDATQTYLGTTDAEGYSSYISLPAYRITSESSALTNGGYNPYSMATVATNYAASSTAFTLSSRNQTVSLSLISTIAPTAPTVPVSSSLTTSAATLGWTDNSDDEDSFVVDYIAVLRGQTYPGTVSLMSSNATSKALSSLTPGETYQFRVAARSAIGDSAYTTSSSFVLPAAVPGAPALTALSGTSLSLSLSLYRT